MFVLHMVFDVRKTYFNSHTLNMRYTQFIRLTRENLSLICVFQNARFTHVAHFPCNVHKDERNLSVIFVKQSLLMGRRL